MPILLLVLVTYLLDSLLNVHIFQQNATFNIESYGFHQDILKKMSTSLFNFNENQFIFNTSKFIEKGICEKKTFQENNQESRGNDKDSISVQDFLLFDPEWDPTFRNNNRSVPNIIINLYETIGNGNSTDLVQKFDLIKCVHVSEYAYITNGIIIKFALNNIQMVEQIIGAELYIYRFLKRPEKASTNSNIVRLYQIISKDVINSRDIDVHELLAVIYVSAYDQGWQIFNVEKSLEKWKNEEPNLNFLISITDTWGNIIDPTHFGLDTTKSNSSFLVVHFRQFPDTIYSTTIENFQPKTSFYKNSSQENGCQRHPFYINFKQRVFNNFIIHPEGLMLYKCNGKCQLQLTDNFTNHARLFNILFQKSNVSESYCVPNKYISATLVFYDRFGNIVIKKYYNLIVDTCSCR